MAVVVVTRFKGNQDFRSTVREGAAILKRHGATSVRAGRCLAGEFAGQLSVVATLPDLAAFGRYAQGLQTDPDWQRFLGDSLKTFELQDRSITTVDDF